MATGIKTLGMQTVLKQVMRTGEELREPRRLLYRFGVAAIRDIGLIFRAGGKPRWKPLKPSTLAARRKGKRKGGSPIPLRNTHMEAAWFAKVISRTRVKIESRSDVAIFHERGTKKRPETPYIIRPKKPGGVLAIPVSPKTLSGLTMSRGRAGVNTGTGRRLRQRGTGAPRIAHKKVTFAKFVKHPGLPRRRMTPTEEQLAASLRKETVAHLKETLGRALTRG